MMTSKTVKSLIANSRRPHSFKNAIITRALPRVCDIYDEIEYLSDYLSNWFSDEVNENFKSLGAKQEREEIPNGYTFPDVYLSREVYGDDIKKCLKNGGKGIRLNPNACFGIEAPQYESGGYRFYTNSRKVQELYEKGKFLPEFCVEGLYGMRRDGLQETANEIKAQCREIEDRISDYCSDHDIEYYIDEESIFQYDATDARAYIQWNEHDIDIEDDFGISVDMSLIDGTRYEDGDWSELDYDILGDVIWAERNLAYQQCNLKLLEAVEELIYKYDEDCEAVAE